MSKFIEELISGDCFEDNNKQYMITPDFRKNGNRLAVSLIDGSSRWFGASEMVEPFDIYMMNSDNLLVAINKNKKNEYQQTVHTTISYKATDF